MRLPGIPGPRDVLAVVERAGALVDELIAAVPRVTALLDTAETLLADAAATQARLAALLDRLEPSLTALQPTLERLAETTDPREVDALVSLVDRLPVLAEQVERDVVPIMRTLTTVAPDLHELLDVSRELNAMLARVPGLTRMLKRYEDD